MRFASVTVAIILMSVPVGFAAATESVDMATSYDDLLVLFADWREFESPPLLDGAPDYTAKQFAARRDDFLQLRERLDAFDIEDWPIPQQVDWHLVRAEMNGYDFNERVLQPWTRDPAFYNTIWTYRSDVPGHEGPTHHALVELWTYEFPLSASEQQRLTSELAVIPPLMKQARGNLTGNARDLWVTGIRDIRGQRAVLAELEESSATRRVMSYRALSRCQKQLPTSSSPGSRPKQNRRRVRRVSARTTTPGTSKTCTLCR